MTSMQPRRLLAAGAALAALALMASRPLAAQARPGPQAPAPPSPQAAPAAQPPQAPEQPGGVIARYLVDSPQVLNLTTKQVVRIHKQLARLDSADAPLRIQWQQITGGRPLREMTPLERRRLAPELQPVMEQLRNNNQAAFDSVDAILTPDQQTRLAQLRSEYAQRLRARRARAGQRP
jgi:hypothetical protein